MAMTEAHDALKREARAIAEGYIIMHRATHEGYGQGCVPDPMML